MTRAPGVFAEHEEGRDGHDPEPAGKPALFVYVDFADRHVAALLRDLLYDGAHHAAGPAPARPEIEQDGAFAAFYELFKIIFRDRVYHDRCSPFVILYRHCTPCAGIFP